MPGIVPLKEVTNSDAIPLAQRLSHIKPKNAVVNKYTANDRKNPIGSAKGTGRHKLTKPIQGQKPPQKVLKRSLSIVKERQLPAKLPKLTRTIINEVVVDASINEINEQLVADTDLHTIIAVVPDNFNSLFKGFKDQPKNDEEHTPQFTNAESQKQCGAIN